jgi:hypothetical protein
LIPYKKRNTKKFEMLFHTNLVDAARDCAATGVNNLGQSGLTDGHGRGGVDGRSGNRVGVWGNGIIAGVRKRSSSVAKDLALSTAGLGGGEFNGDNSALVAETS